MICLKHIFEALNYLDQNQLDYWLEKISIIYDKDLTDTINCYLDYSWAEIDNKNPDEILNKYLKLQKGVKN